MYKVLLILRYLRKRRIAWVALAAVTLCTAMVLVVISVMGGWLNMFKASFHGLAGDVIVHTGSLGNFPYYQEMTDEIEKLPSVEAAVPVIRTFGVIKGEGESPEGVTVLGYPIDKIGRVNAFPQSLYLQYKQYVEAAANKSLPPEVRQEAQRLADLHAHSASFALPLAPDVYRQLVHNPRQTPETWPGMIVGSGLLGIPKGPGVARGEWIYEFPLTLTVVAMGPDATLDPNNATVRKYWIVDDSHTGVWQYDTKTVYVPFDVLQKDLQMDAVSVEENGKTRVEPARASEINVKIKPGYDMNVAAPEIARVIDAVQARHTGSQPPLTAETWEHNQAHLIGAIENEKVLLTILFGIISIVAVFLIFCIFYMIVQEKIRDIGIIKSVGATDAGVAGVFLGYGLTIGLTGAGLGLLVGYLVIHNINYLHHQLGVWMHVQIWDPEVYAFDTIPNRMNPAEVAWILTIAVLSAVLGAVVPAVRAARLNPVESLRWE